MIRIYMIRTVSVVYLVTSVTIFKKYIFPLFSHWLMVFFNLLILYLLYRIDIMAALIFLVVMMIGISCNSVQHIEKIKKRPSKTVPIPSTPASSTVLLASIPEAEQPTNRFLLSDNGFVQGYEYAQPNKFTFI